MTNGLKSLLITNFVTQNHTKIDAIKLSYQLFGKPLGDAPIVLVNHALTGNSNVCGDNGWWCSLVGSGKVIDTDFYTVLAFNIPGNGYDGFMITNYQNFVAKDIAELFLLGLKKLNIKKLFTIIGGSLGGGIAWEMLALSPKLTQHLVPIASDWKSTDWLIANCKLQALILNNSKQPVYDARVHAMLSYRTPQSLNNRFNRANDNGVFEVENWLNHHGKILQNRFQLAAYKLMNQLLSGINAAKSHKNIASALKTTSATICIVGVNTDLFFIPEENKKTKNTLRAAGLKVHYNEIQSEHGHDAFLMEYQQLASILKPIFKTDIAINKPKAVNHIANV